MRPPRERGAIGGIAEPLQVRKVRDVIDPQFRRSRIDARLDLIARQAVTADDIDERIGHRMSAYAAWRHVLDLVAPPLQADFAHHRLGDGCRDARQLAFECRKDQEIGAGGGWGEKGREVMVVRVRARNLDDLLA